MATKETELQIEDESWSDWGDIDQSESVATEAKEQEKVKEDWSNWGDDEKGDETLLDEPKSTVAKKQAGAMKIKSAAKKSNSSPGSSNVSPRDEKQQKGGKNVTPKDLGKEFEIPDITAKLPDPEPDFFADMVPTVKSNVVSLDELMKSSKSKSKTTKEMSNKEREAIEAEIEAELSASFGAIETTDELETGWGDDDLNLDVQAEEET
uniref:Protein-associating with the carboxyl-terminal domain of ezrin-like n=1 Tax=Saccoglossus kowalevskii TaxID=10224 RepID=A0ABM0GTB8_SACKO|nr:PREDICTED: protein-associating with the carboxyl-terminal domain of ezrin-like [Saccoglossus kowalevskii]